MGLRCEQVRNILAFSSGDDKSKHDWLKERTYT